MGQERRTEILILYIGYFLTLAIEIIPSLRWYAFGALALQLLYAILRYVGTDASEAVFRSHAYNYILAVGVSFVVAVLLIVQIQANGLDLMHIVGSLFSAGTYSIQSLGYAIFMMGLEAAFGIFWPIVLIGRGLYLVDSGTPIFGGNRALQQGVSRPQSNSAGATRSQVGRWLASAVMQNGHIVQFEIDGGNPTRVIGRDAKEADVVLADDSVSRRHARIELKNGSIWISDLGSLNKTKVNGRDIGVSASPLQPSDKVKLGDVTLTISVA